MRRGFGDVFAVLVAALAHDIEEQDAALPGIHQIFDRFGNEPGHLAAGECRIFSHDVPSPKQAGGTLRIAVARPLI